MLVECGNKMTRLVTILSLAAAFVLLPGNLPAQSNRLRNNTKYIDALISEPALVTYGDDGAGDATVMNIGTNDMGIVERPLPAVRDLVKLGPTAIPLLIAHLDDTRLTSAKFFYYRRGKERTLPVPVGHVCLDILTSIIKAPRIFTAECGDDRLGACFEVGYYFRPDAYVSNGDRVVALAIVYRAKSNWQRAYKGLHQVSISRMVEASHLRACNGPESACLSSISCHTMQLSPPRNPGC